MAFLSIVVGEFVSRKLGRKLLMPLIFFGLFSVFYWIISEQYGAGDLRPYAVVQFLPMLIIPAIIFSWKSETIKTSDLLTIPTGYGLAKLLEFFDMQVYQLTTVSGHSLKHLAAAFSVYWVLHTFGRTGNKAQHPPITNRYGENHESR